MGPFTVVFHKTGYATVHFMDKQIYDIVFSHALHPEITQEQRNLVLAQIDAMNTHATECSNIA